MVRKKKASDTGESPLQDFDSHEILYAVDRLDDVRPILSDDGYNPPEIRNQLLKLHSMVMQKGSVSGPEGRKRHSRILTLADEIEADVEQCIDNLEKISEVVGKLLSLAGDEEWEEPEEDESLE